MKGKAMMKILGVVVLTGSLLTACGAVPANQEEHFQHSEATGHSGGQGDAGHEHHSGSSAVEVTTDWKLSSGKPRPGEETTLSIQINDGRGDPIEQFDLNHEKLLHLIVISRDLSYFNHIHPEYKGKGLFEIRTSFPENGSYKLIADFMPSGSAMLTESHWMEVGQERNNASMESVRPDNTLTKTIQGTEVTLSFDKLQAGKDVQLKFSFKDAQTGRPVTDLEPYLGAVGHVVVISGDAEQYIHNHPVDEKASGPEAAFATSFPKSGVYKLWGQFQRNGQVFTVPYVVQVP